MDEATIDREVSAGDVTSPVASEQQCKVRDFLGPGEASGDRVGCRVCCDVAWFDSDGLGDRLSHTVVSSQSVVFTGPGLIRSAARAINSMGPSVVVRSTGTKTTRPSVSRAEPSEARRAGSGNHRGAFVDQRPGDRPADSLTGAGDDGDLATQMQVHLLLLAFSATGQLEVACDP